MLHLMKKIINFIHANQYESDDEYLAEGIAPVSKSLQYDYASRSEIIHGKSNSHGRNECDELSQIHCRVEWRADRIGSFH